MVNPEPLSTLIYDFSGSSYHYNSDYGVSTRYAYIVNAGVEKSFSPKTITPGNNSTLTFTINNPGAEQIDDVNFTDDLPANVSLANANVSYTGCGTPSPTSGSLTDPLTFTNITVAASSTCTIAVTVTSNTTGTYANTTGTLKIGATDTGDTASDTLVVSSSPAPPSTCTSSTTLATWNFNSLSTGINSGPFAGTTSGTASGATTSYGSGGGSSSGIANSTSNTFAGDPSGFVNPVALDGNTWGIQEGWSSSGTPTGSTTPYFQFQVNAIDYGGLVLTASANLGGSWSNGDNWYVLASTDGTNWTQRGTGAWGTTGYKNNWGSVSNNTSTPANAATTYFRIIFVGSQSGKADDTVFLDNVSISGCSNPPPPTISKSFQTDPISVASASTLTFTIDNTTSGADNLTGVSFTDVLPGGLVINTPNSLSTNCSGTVTATAGTSTISWSGSLTANNSCTISVSIKGNTAGSYTNTTTNITATESGANTSTTPNVGFGQDTLTVIAPPVIAKSFTANPIFTGNTTYLNFSINNPNTSTALTNIAFTDNLPSGLVVDTTTTAPATPATSTCGGTLTANDGALSVQLSGVNSLAAGDTCTITVRVRGTTTGLKSNFVTVSSSNGGTGNTATASVLVKDPEPKISLLKSVGPTNTGPWTPSLTVTIPGNVYY
ncbi:MAG: DUF11 domain-containing protein, partial [Chloroflexi bacterium]|nr:DUF11 domain-containing protein [Chloroflexota bacterium]